MDGSYDSSRFSFLKCLNTDFPIVATHVYIPSNRAGVPFFLHILINICFPDDSHSDWDERESPGLIFISHMMKGIEYFFKIIYWPSVFFFFLLRTIYSFDWSIGWLIWLDDFLIFNFCSSSGGLNINYLMMCSGQSFFSNSGSPPPPPPHSLYSGDGFACWAESWSSMRPHSCYFLHCWSPCEKVPAPAFILKYSTYVFLQQFQSFWLIFRSPVDSESILGQTLA